MRKVSLFCLVFAMLVLISVPTYALNTPMVTEGHGVILGMFVGGNNIMLGGEFGFTPDIGFTGRVGANGLKLAGKYEINPSSGVLAGFYNSVPFVGVNGAASLANNVTGIYELDVTMQGAGLGIIYEVGARYKLSQLVDIRGGLIGSINSSVEVPAVELGLGYHF